MRSAPATPTAIAEVHAHYRGAESTTFALHDAQLVLARAYGFDSWPKLKAYVDGATGRGEMIKPVELEYRGRPRHVGHHRRRVRR